MSNVVFSEKPCEDVSVRVVRGAGSWYREAQASLYSRPSCIWLPL